MRECKRIIKRESLEVNGSTRIRENFSVMIRLIFVIVVVALLVSFATSCADPEQKAERLYKKARHHVDDDELDLAIEKYREILERYPQSPAARRAKEELTLFRGLQTAVQNYPMRSARDQLVLVAREIQRYRERKRRWPDKLESLVPEFLAELPVDPWERTLMFEQKESGTGYRLFSYGSDGTPGGEGENGDWLVEDGAFVTTPLSGGG